MAVHSWLRHTVHCMEKIVSVHLCAGSKSVERVGWVEVGGVTRRVLCSQFSPWLHEQT